MAPWAGGSRGFHTSNSSISRKSYITRLQCTDKTHSVKCSKTANYSRAVSARLRSCSSSSSETTRFAVNQIPLVIPSDVSVAAQPLNDCDSCLYPCYEREGACEVDYLQLWAEEDIFKPVNFDARIILPTTSGAEVAAVSVGGRSNGKWKRKNQDTFLLHQLSNPASGRPHANSPFLMGVFDGHGRFGHEVARQARDALGSAASRAVPAPDADPEVHEEWLAQCFAVAADVVDSTEADFSRSGAAAVVCAVQPGRVTAAWAGDSRAVLGLHMCTGDQVTRAVLPLTRDHKPDPTSCPSEAERILASGGRVDRIATDIHGNPVGPFRVFLPDAWTPGLALSRAFGDHIARRIGIVPTPDLNSFPLPQTPSSSNPAARNVLIVASDGLWEWIDTKEAVAIAWQYGTAKAAAEALAQMAQLEWAQRYYGRTCDDITVAVAFL